MKWRILTLASGTALVAACTDPPAAPSLHAFTGTPAAATSLWAESVTGETGPGSQYALYKPVNWNGDAVFYAHGFVDAAAPVAIPTTQDNATALRDAFGAMGYAVAMSSYSSNGYDFDDGLRRTHQLKGLLTSQFGKPGRSYLAGHSLGAQISQALAESFGSQYDGALLMCGVLGGSRAHFNWLGDIRVLFDHFYPGVLPGDVTQWPSNLNPYVVVQPAVLGALANPTGFGAMLRIDQIPLAGTNQTQLVTSLITALIWHARGIADVTDRTQGHLPYGNVGRTYTSSTLPPAFMALLDSTVARYESPPDAQAALRHNYEPSGAVRIPVLTLHTLWDPSVPYFHENLFAGLVARAGTGSMVVQRPIFTYGHCNFTQQEVLTAFGDLVNWVTNGVRPTP
jgi:pimeloyl-ACP methyl ester carboxylesterase